mmetsp:Transcript_24192/g.60562  ORF Transcript_24192/g.60562 Transcript_24192/m.60562 type:complete len:322 (-) Transcript_24192:150-1115(-)
MLHTTYYFRKFQKFSKSLGGSLVGISTGAWWSSFLENHTRVLITIFLCVSYLFLGTLFFTLVEDLNVRDGLYFVIITVTTIGYGDVSPTTRGGKIFCVFYMYCAIAVIGFVLGEIGSHLVERSARRLIKRHLKKKDPMAIFKKKKEAIISKVIVSFVLIIAANLFGVIFLVYAEEFDFTDAFYFAGYTLTTVGYGDLALPENARIFMIFYAFIGVAVTTTSIATLANAYVELKSITAMRKGLNQVVDKHSLQEMDENNDGMVDRGEFLRYMLQHLQLVDRAMLERIDAQFKTLDKDDNGLLEVEDLNLYDIANSLRSRGTQ